MITDFDEDPDFPSAYPVEFNRTDQWSPKDVLVDASRHTRGNSPGLQIRVSIGYLFPSFLIQNICCGYSKEPSQ